MKKVQNIMIVLVLLVICAAAGFHAGRSAGFKTGSEWALVQADIVAREAGVFMPIYMEGDSFRVIIKQPKGLYKKAWDLADTYEEARNTLCIDQKKAGDVRKRL
jgi:hypothetical protein